MIVIVSFLPSFLPCCCPGVLVYVVQETWFAAETQDGFDQWAQVVDVRDHPTLLIAPLPTSPHL